MYTPSPFDSYFDIITLARWLFAGLMCLNFVLAAVTIVGLWDRVNNMFHLSLTFISCCGIFFLLLFGANYIQESMMLWRPEEWRSDAVNCWINTTTPPGFIFGMYLVILRYLIKTWDDKPKEDAVEDPEGPYVANAEAFVFEESD